ncbi:cell division protein ZapA [Cohaesibacter haloalkalitolerans]|uniref:cell division protein ZapA n=1 Tax=Cohaesibacter haloalkalitolerans TaxID=1162980 RepID=UPI000E656FEF|nr:cell division protein ZapA [Cohaesibacter haloalkalitolerans]
MVQVSVSINGRAYRMACEDGQEEHLLALARRFDGMIAQLKENFGEIGDQRLTVMAGIMAMDLLAEADGRVKHLNEEISALRDARSAVLEKSEGDQEALASRIDKAAEELERLSKVLLES